MSLTVIYWGFLKETHVVKDQCVTDDRFYFKMFKNELTLPTECKEVAVLTFYQRCVCSSSTDVSTYPQPQVYLPC